MKNEKSSSSRALLLIGCLIFFVACSTNAQNAHNIQFDSAYSGANESVGHDVYRINGGISIEEDETVNNVSIVNGDVFIKEGAKAHNVYVVNGEIRALRNSEILGTAFTVNGDIRISQATIGKNLETRHGNINITQSVIEQDIIVHERQPQSGLFKFLHRRASNRIVVIGPGTKINGSLIARQDIDLYVHESAIIGNIIGAVPEMYVDDLLF
jgi:hypothetical protein